MSQSLQKASYILQENSSFLISGHINPDGDSLGCMCALGIALERLGKSAALVSVDGVPELYRFLPGSERVLREVPANRKFDAAIVVDCEHFDRTGIGLEVFAACKAILVIDHHLSDGTCDIARLVDNSAASCGELVLELLQSVGARIDPDTAECLLTAIITDTGTFRFSNVRPATLRAAAYLLEAGASPSRITQKVYETRSPAGTRLLGSALSTLHTAAGGRVAYASISRDQMDSAEAAEDETEGIVNYVRSVRGAEVGILFKEGPNGATRVSLRSRDGLDISQVAKLFGGGGHRVAAGCTVDRPLPEAVSLVVDAVQKWMGS